MEPESLLPASPQPPQIESAIIPAGGRKKPRLKFLTLLGALVVLLGAGAYTFSYLQNSPDKVLAKMRAQLPLIASGKFQARAGLSFPPEVFMPNLNSVPRQNPAALPYLIKASLKLNGAFDTGDKGQPKADVQLSGKIEGLSQDPFDVSGNFRSIGNSAFLKPNQLPPMAGFDLSPLLGTWLILDRQEFAQDLEPSRQMSTSSAPTTDDFTSVKQFYIDIGRLYSQNLVVTKNYGRKTLSGRSVYHYQVALDQKNLAKALEDYANSSPDPRAKNYAGIVKADLASLQALNAELWVGQQDYLPYQVKFDIPLGPTGGHMAMTLELSDYNQPVTIAAPEDAKSFQEMMQKVFQQAQTTPANGNAK